MAGLRDNSLHVQTFIPCQYQALRNHVYNSLMEQNVRHTCQSYLERHNSACQSYLELPNSTKCTTCLKNSSSLCN